GRLVGRPLGRLVGRLRPLPRRHLGDQAAAGEVEVLVLELDAEVAVAEADGGDAGGAAAVEGVEDGAAGLAGGDEEPLEERERLLGRVAAVELLALARRGHPQDGLHLAPAVLLAHLVVGEVVLALAVARGPEARLGRVGEVAAREVGGRVRLLPDYLVQRLESVLLHCVADRVVVEDFTRVPATASSTQTTLPGCTP